jgi:hypothetical protein
MSRTKDQKKNALGDALLQAGLGMMAGKSQHAFQNIGEGGAAGLAAYRDSQKANQARDDKLLAAQGDMVKSRISLEKGDQQTATAAANQARQEQQAAAQYDMLGKYYAGAVGAQNAAANARMGGYGMAGDKQKLADLRAMQADYMGRLKDKMLALPSRAGERAGIVAKLDAINAQLAQMAGMDTMMAQAPQTPGAGGQLPPLNSFYVK